MKMASLLRFATNRDYSPVGPEAAAKAIEKGLAYGEWYKSSLPRDYILPMQSWRVKLEALGIPRIHVAAAIVAVATWSLPTLIGGPNIYGIWFR